MGTLEVDGWRCLVEVQKFAARILEAKDMTTRVYELAAELDVDSKSLLEQCDKLGIPVTSHKQGLTDEQVSVLRAAQTGSKATVTRFDKSTGKGQVKVSSGDGDKELSFDLRYTRLDDEKYIPIDAGDSVQVQLDEEAVVAIRSDRS